MLLPFMAQLCDWPTFSEGFKSIENYFYLDKKLWPIILLEKKQINTFYIGHTQSIILLIV